MKRKKSASKKEIVHWMQVDATNRGEDEQHKKEKQQRYGREGTDSPCQRTGLQLLRQGETYFVAGYQILVTPDQFRPATDFVSCVGESVFSGKSKPLKSVVSRNSKSRTWLTWSPKL